MRSFDFHLRAISQDIAKIYIPDMDLVIANQYNNRISYAAKNTVDLQRGILFHIGRNIPIVWTFQGI